MPSLPDLIEPLTDGEVELRLYAERDIPEILIAYQDDPSMHKQLGEARPPSGAQLGRAAERAEDERLTGNCVWLTLVRPGSEDCIGQVRVKRVDWAAGTAELDVWIAPQARGRGYARRGLALVRAWLADSGLEVL